MLKEIPSDTTSETTTKELERLAEIECSLAWANIENHPFKETPEEKQQVKNAEN